MEWLRKLFGYHYRPGEDDNPFRSPTWDEIIKQRDLKDSQDSQMQHPWGPFFHDGFPPHQELFGQVDDMFSRLEDMMKEMHSHPAWALPELQAEPEPQTPRDFMLKVPDNDETRTVPPPAPHQRLHGHEDEMPGFQSGYDDFSQHANPFTSSPHIFFDGIFKQFGMNPSEAPFPDHLPEIGPGSNPEEHSRKSLMKKEDSDIDDRVLGDLSKLPEGGPGYSHRLPQTQEPEGSPWSHPVPPGSPYAGVRHKFYSHSIVTIRRPDGSIEETKKYSDSTGREEVTVTHKQPEDGSSGIGSLQPEGPVDQGPSIFSWFFRR